MSAAALRAVALALLLPLAGCVNMSGLSGESKYACAAPEGVACDSVSGTYANAVHHNLPSQRTTTSASATASGTTSTDVGQAAASRPTATAAPARQPLAGTLASVAQAGADGQPGLALRSQARVLRLWTKPWEDADGDLWDQGFVYVQVDAGRWQIDHVRQRIRDQYTPLRPPPATGSTGSTSSAAPAGGSDPSGAEVEGGNPPDGGVQRPAGYPFPSLSRPPTGLGPRTQ